MKCDEIREILSGYVDGEARGDEGRLAEDHLASCASCRDLARRMRLVGEAAGRAEGVVPPGFREALFSRMEREGLLPRRRSLFAYSVRWAAIPIAAAATLALFVLTSRDAGRVGPAAPQKQAHVDRAPRAQPEQELNRVARETGGTPGPVAGPETGATASVAGRVPGELTAEEREIVAHLDVLEDPAALDEPSEIDELDIVEPAARTRG